MPIVAARDVLENERGEVEAEDTRWKQEISVAVTDLAASVAAIRGNGMVGWRVAPSKRMSGHV